MAPSTPDSRSSSPIEISDSPSQKRMHWSSDEDNRTAYNAYKKQKTNARNAEAAAGRKAKAAVEQSRSSIVGRKGQISLSKQKSRQRYGKSPSEDSADDAIEKAQPESLKQRRGQFERDRQRNGQEGLKLPPLFGYGFDEDGKSPAQRAIKPILPALKPPAPFQDVHLRYSAGIVPAPIAQWLRPYQVQGAEFLHELFVWQRGGMLGDDMGLGKTIQVIAFLTAAFGKHGDERDEHRMRRARRYGGDAWYPKVLIVCPGGLMSNWQSELNRWGWWQIGVFHGAERASVLEAARTGRLEIVITTYTTYRNSQEAINMVDWDACIADECHQIKEHKAETTQAMDKINALCRIGLTGTAIQNKYEELWTLLNWTNPGKLGPLSVWKYSIAAPLKMGQSHDATQAQLATARKTAKKLVANLLPQFFLRRMKTLIADQLPKKTDKVVFCPLTDAQASAYELLVDSEIMQLIRRSSEDCECGSGKKRGWCCHTSAPDERSWQALVFPALATLQKLSNHLAMLIPSGGDAKEKQEKDVEWLQLALPDTWRALWDTRDSILHFANQEFCGKWTVLKKLLRFWHQDMSASGGGTANKVLVFSHSVRLLRMLRMLFQSTTSYNVSYLDGEMSYELRQRAVDEFNACAEQFVFLISTKAGGVGLNITSANKVVVFDPNWNPSYDLQAQDRAYRIGQTRDVEVYRLVSAGTVEEIVYARQVYKQQQANIAYQASEERRYFKGVQGTADRGEIFGLKNMFSYKEGVVLKDIVNKTNVAESKAGVDVVELESTQDDDGDEDWALDGDKRNDAAKAAISHVAAMLVGDEEAIKKEEAKRKATDAVAAILAGVGVEYTHENSEVVGTSKVEAQLSKAAEAAGGMGNQQVFMRSQDNAAGADREGGDDDSGDEGELGKIRYRYQPPEHVRKRQFVTMANMAGHGDATEFALMVESWTQEQRREFLDKFYRQRRRLLSHGAEL